MVLLVVGYPPEEMVMVLCMHSWARVRVDVRFGSVRVTSIIRLVRVIKRLLYHASYMCGLKFPSQRILCSDLIMKIASHLCTNLCVQIYINYVIYNIVQK